MKLTTEQIEKILDGAPNGVNQFEECGKYWFISDSSEIYLESPMHHLSDLREIISLRQHVQVLKRYKDLAEAYLDIYNCKKCNGLVNRGFICHSCGDTDPTRPKDKADEWF